MDLTVFAPDFVIPKPLISLELPLSYRIQLMEKQERVQKRGQKYRFEIRKSMKQIKEHRKLMFKKQLFQTDEESCDSKAQQPDYFVKKVIQAEHGLKKQSIDQDVSDNEGWVAGDMC